MEKSSVTGVAVDTRESKITISGLPNCPGVTTGIFASVARAGVWIGLSTQSVSTSNPISAMLSFTVPKDRAGQVLGLLRSLQVEMGFDAVSRDDRVGRLSLVGTGLRSDPGIHAILFSVLAGAGISIQAIWNAGNLISVLMRADQLESAVHLTKLAFGLDSQQREDFF